jgi:myo-inositol-1(or 4)-monophosphatase
VNAERLLALAVEAAELAAREHRRRPVELSFETKSSTTDPVTAVDRAAERLIVEHLTAARPDDGFLGEEGTARPSRSGVSWIIDPLDGTVNYLYGYPAHAVSIAAEVHGQVVAGVVHDTARAEVFTAVLGGGAHLDGASVRANRPASLADALLGTGFGYDAARRHWQAEVLTGLIAHVRDVRRGGSAALDLCSVACGRLDLFYEIGLQPWDMAAGSLIATEAGSVFRWQPEVPRLVVAPPDLLAAFSDAIAAAEQTAGPPP